MKRTIAGYAIAIIATVGLVGAASAQDLEVTMDVVPAGAAAPAVTGTIELPQEAPPQAHENAAFGLETANRAREQRLELNREFGQEVAEAARERAGERIPDIGMPGRP